MMSAASAFVLMLVAFLFGGLWGFRLGYGACLIKWQASVAQMKRAVDALPPIPIEEQP